MPNTIARRPETTLTRLPDVIDQLFRESFVLPTRYERLFDGKPSFNLIETDYAYIVQLALLGADPEKVEIQVVGDQLKVKAPYAVPTVEKGTYLFQGLTPGEFSEAFTLPMEVDGEKAEATYDKGILTITLPKAEHVKPKAIKVHATT